MQTIQNYTWHKIQSVIVETAETFHKLSGPEICSAPLLVSRCFLLSPCCSSSRPGVHQGLCTCCVPFLKHSVPRYSRSSFLIPFSGLPQCRLLRVAFPVHWIYTYSKIHLPSCVFLLTLTCTWTMYLFGYMCILVGTSGEEPTCQCRLDVGDAGSIPGSERSPGGGHSNPLQYCCLENPVESGAWQAAVLRVTQSWTWLKPCNMQACTHISHLGLLLQSIIDWWLKQCIFSWF